MVHLVYSRHGVTFRCSLDVFSSSFFHPPPLRDYFWKNTHNSFAHKDDRYQEGFRYYLTKLEEKQLNEANQPFRLVSPEEELIMCRLRKPKRNETPKRMSSTMICQLLVGGPGRGLSIQKISQAMRKCGFNSIQRSGYELFLVVEIPYDQQQNYLSLEKDESQNLEEETPQTIDNQQLDLPF